MCNSSEMDNNGFREESYTIDWDSDDDLEISAGIGLQGQAITRNEEGDNAFGTENVKIDWDSDDDLEIEAATTSRGERIVGSDEASTSMDPSKLKLIKHFVDMGFPAIDVEKAIKENEDDNAEDRILETLLTNSALKDSPQHETCPQQPACTISDHSSSEYDESSLYDLSDSDIWSDNEFKEITNSLPENDDKLLTLAKMGYNVEEASIAMERCGPEASIDELVDCITAHQLVKDEDGQLLEYPLGMQPRIKKKKLYRCELQNRKRQRILGGDDDTIRLPKPMVGFGVPLELAPESNRIIHRALPEQAIAPPFFYYENVALAPKGVWDTISRFLYGVEPEFVDSKYFSAAARKRGYIHNLPIQNRFPLVPLPPLTIEEAFPLTKKWWPAWDERRKLNCIQTCIASARLTDRIRKALETCDGEPPPGVQKYVLDQCRKWNLVWVGKNKLAPLEPDEVESLLGFPRNHTRGGGISRTDRYKSLGNSFQVDTVAYHLSVLKDIYPGGINVLSLFSGIGGAEVALHRLGIPLKVVVSVEKSEANRNIVQSWWEQTNQKGTLIHFDDVQQLHADRLGNLMSTFGGFDLVVGGSPCNNLAGSNRVSRDGLEGKESSLFYDYFRILDLIKCIMRR